jgi:hypothetical protein
MRDIAPDIRKQKLAAEKRWICRFCRTILPFATETSLNPGMGTTIRRLAEFSPRTLALMHGPSFSGDGASALRALANDYDQRILRSRP